MVVIPFRLGLATENVAYVGALMGGYGGPSLSRACVLHRSRSIRLTTSTGASYGNYGYRSL